MKMDTIQIRLPKSIKEKIKALVKRHGYAHESDFIRIAIREKIEKYERGGKNGNEHMGERNR